MKKTLAFWHVPASQKLLQILQEQQNVLNVIITQFNDYKKNMKNRDDIVVNNMIRCYSFNGAKFDNHFVLSHIKQIEGDSWIDHVNIIGDQTDMKCMIYRSF